tara:strand:- start:506 stop:661 length:156 start_codon:yes stop_codon:yes gene_type:complete
MKNWELIFNFHFPHDRCAVGWEYIGPDEKEKINTFTIYLFILTINFNIFEH